MNLYVGNLSFTTREDELKALFAQYGEVTSVKIIMDQATGKSKGFAFVEMPNKEEGLNAINNLNNKEVNKRNLKVNEARPKEGGNRSFGGGGGGGFRNKPRY
jgi:RNA recognition motif-containing protein